jgi:hypothetical protein
MKYFLTLISFIFSLSISSCSKSEAKNEEGETYLEKKLEIL